MKFLASEAVADPEIRAMALEGFVELDKAFAACFRLAREKGEHRYRRPDRTRAPRLGHHPHHRDPRPRPRAAQGIGSDRQRRAGCDAGRQGVNHQNVGPANAPPSRGREGICLRRVLGNPPRRGSTVAAIANVRIRGVKQTWISRIVMSKITRKWLNRAFPIQHGFRCCAAYREFCWTAIAATAQKRYEETP